MSKALNPSRRGRDLLSAGGAYLLALGAGVLIGAAVAIVFVVIGSSFLIVAGASTEPAQRRLPAIGRLPLVEDQGFEVVSGEEWRRQSAALASAHGTSAKARPPSFEELKPLVEGYLEEGRRIWIALESQPTPDRVGALFDDASGWQKAAAADLNRYQPSLADDFRQGGHILSPQLRDLHPTDRESLVVFVERRGYVLRNLLEGTPGKNLEWGTDRSDIPF